MEGVRGQEVMKGRGGEEEEGDRKRLTCSSRDNEHSLPLGADNDDIYKQKRVYYQFALGHPGYHVLVKLVLHCLN